MPDGDVDQLGDAIFPFCYDGSYLGVRLLKSIVSGGHDKPLDFCYLFRLMVVEQLDVADVRCISTGANDRGTPHDLRRTEDRVIVTADDEVDVVHRFGQSTVSNVAGVGQEDDDIDVGFDRVNGRTDGRDLPVESHSFVALRRGNVSSFLRCDADDARRAGSPNSASRRARRRSVRLRDCVRLRSAVGKSAISR